jgi:hypothetical protein
MEDFRLEAPACAAIKREGGERLGPMSDGKNRIMIFRPKADGTYVMEFRASTGETLAIPIPRTEAHIIRHFKERMPYGLFVPEVPSK